MVDKGGCKVGKKSDKGGCKEGKKKEEKPKPKKKLVLRKKPKVEEKPKMEAKPKKKLVLKPKKKKEPTHIVMGREVPLHIKLAGVKDYRGGVKGTKGGIGEGANLSDAQKRASKGNSGSFVVIDTKTGKVYDSLSDYNKGKVSGEEKTDIKYKGRKRSGIRIEGVGDFIKAPVGGDPSYAFIWIGDMFNSR